MNNRQIQHLAWAVGEAETWRGSLVGNPDEGPLERFDAAITKAKQAVKAARADKRLITELKKRNNELEDRVRGLSAS